ncbi:MAG: cation diffusion facilitator family transporter [Eubacteriales bacterium]|jgi:cation diffusion facilitator family transporter
MTDLLVRTFVPDYKNIHSPAVRERYGILSSGVAIVCNLLLFAAKLLMGLISGSIAIIGDAFNNLSDVGSGVVTYIGFRMASQPADEEHPFGHGRIEYISGLVIAFFILMVGVEVLKTSFDKILHPEDIVFSPIVIATLVLSIGVKLWMGRFNGILGNRIDSQTMKAAAADSMSDCISTGATTLGVIAAGFLPFSIDGWLGLMVGCFILYAGYGIVKDTISPLLGQRPDADLVKQVEKELLSYDIIEGVHDLIIHDYGPGRMMGSAHVEVPANSDILMAHDIIDNAEKRIQATLHIPFVLHLDPIVTDCEEVNELRRQLNLIVSRIDTEMSIHDFRMVQGHTHTNLIFDVLVPHTYREKNSTLKKAIDAEVKRLDPNYFTVITFDRSYI